MGSATKLAFSVFLISCSSGESAGTYSSHLSVHTLGTGRCTTDHSICTDESVSAGISAIFIMD